MSDEFREKASALNAVRREKEKIRAALAFARDKAARNLGNDQERARAAFDKVKAREIAAMDAMGEWSDPRRAIGVHADTDPILMLPVRIETRFKALPPADGAREARHELWLRIYPDDCAIDTFELLPSDAEIAAAKMYWLEIWRSGGEEAGARTAWRGLVRSVGAGRGAWLVRNYTPLNLADKPTKLPADETLLVAGTETAAPTATITALATYWPAAWRANKDAAVLSAARQALDADFGGDAAAADTALSKYRPYNLADNPKSDRNTAPVRFVMVVFQDSAQIDAQRFSWASAPKAHVMPDRFVALGYEAAYAPGAKPSFTALGEPVPSPLIVGIDPNAPRGEQVDEANGALKFGEDIAWMVEFDAAVAKGMGLRIPLTAAQARNGFARIVVIGIRATADAQEGRALLETLFAHHRDSAKGIALIKQGAATNNTDGKPADLKLTEDAEATFDLTFKPAGEPVVSSDWSKQQDGARLAALLGISAQTLRGVAGINGADQLEARAMHAALFPGTLGYFLNDMIGPSATPEVISFARRFLLDAVSGRGPAPALRIGAQPYGILPTTAYSRLAFAQTRDRSPNNWLNKIADAMRIAERDWAAAAERASWIGKDEDSHRSLLDLLGHHPASVEFHRRAAESIEEHINRLHLANLGIIGGILAMVLRAFRTEEVPQHLAKLGWTLPQPAPLAQRLFSARQFEMGGPVIDEPPLSEIDSILPTTTDGHNYLFWLASAALSSMNVLQTQSGFVKNAPPRALLYIILRFALLNGYRHEGTDRLLAAGVIDQATALAYRRDPLFVHVKAEAASESRWKQLYESAPRGDDAGQGVLLHERIAADLRTRVASYALREQVDAIEALKDLPTARLERLFVEHLDCLSYRLDAWRTGLAYTRLKDMRNAQGEAGHGVLIGAYGWVEGLKPRDPLTPVVLPEDIAVHFAEDTAEPLMHDPRNQGFIHAPSMDHAVTAAILRNGHMSNAGPQQDSEYTVNLTSERVRRAADIMQGMREGQSLGALLGYQFERGLHERHAPLELDKFIQPMRNQFPLDANRLPETAEPAGPNESVAARNVIDGRRFADTVRKLDPAARIYPFGIPNQPGANSAEAKAIEIEADRLLDTLDAVADVGLAESVHQYARGNIDRAAGMLDAMAKGGPPPEPEVTQTPRTGISLTHRVALHLDSNASVPAGATPRARAEPRISNWLAQRLPAMADIACSVTYYDQAQNQVSSPVPVTMADLGLEAIDLVRMTQDDARQGMGALDHLIVRHVQTTRPVCPDSQTTIDYASPVAGAFTLFALAPVLGSLRGLLSSSRAVRGVDLGPPANPYPDPEPRLKLEPARIADHIPALEGIRDACVALATAAAAAAKAARDVVAGARDALIADVDAWAETLAVQSLKVMLYGGSASGFDAAQAGRRRIFAAYRTKITETATRWRAKLTEANSFLAKDATLAAAPGSLDADRVQALRGAEERISSDLSPETAPAPLRIAVIAKRDAFVTKLVAFEAASRTAETTISGLAAEAKALLPVDAFERLGPSFEDEESFATRFADDIAASAGALAAETDASVTKAKGAIDAAGAAARASDSAKALDEAGKVLFGEDFLIVHGVHLSEVAREDGATQTGAWTAAIAGAGPAGLLHHLVSDLDRLDPVDEWFAGAARVRAPMKHIERVAILSEGFGAVPMKLDAFQIPYAAGDSWLAAEFPQEQDLGVERLLYTAHLPSAWNTAQSLYALLVDEWVELLPNEAETTGLAFHFDRPNAEPPQSMLLVAPPVMTGAWRWDDVVDAVNETLDLAKQRAVEPSLFDQTPYARFLPALMFSTAHSDITIVADLALNNVTLNLARNP